MFVLSRLLSLELSNLELSYSLVLLQHLNGILMDAMWNFE